MTCLHGPRWPAAPPVLASRVPRTVSRVFAVSSQQAAPHAWLDDSADLVVLPSEGAGPSGRHVTAFRSSSSRTAGGRGVASTPTAGPQPGSACVQQRAAVAPREAAPDGPPTAQPPGLVHGAITAFDSSSSSSRWDQRRGSASRAWAPPAQLPLPTSAHERDPAAEQPHRQHHCHQRQQPYHACERGAGGGGVDGCVCTPDGSQLSGGDAVCSTSGRGVSSSSSSSGGGTTTTTTSGSSSSSSSSFAFDGTAAAHDGRGGYGRSDAAPRPLGDGHGAWLARRLTADVKAARSWQALAALVAEHGDASLNHIHVCALITQAAKVVHFRALPPDQADAFSAWYCSLLDMAFVRLGEAQPREVANQLWAIARLGVHPGGEWLDAYLQQAAPRLAGFASQEVGTVAWALARFGHRPRAAWLTAFLAHAARAAPRLDGQALSNLLWGMATLGVAPAHGGTEWCGAVAAALAQQAARMTPQGLANALWALARLGGPPPEGAVLAACCAAAHARSGAFKPAEAVMVLHACARLRFRPPAPLVDALQARGGAGALGFVEAANMLWALAVLGCAPEAAWAEACLQQLRARCAQQADGHAMASALHAMALLQLRPPEVWWDAPLAWLAAHALSLDARALATILTALARLRMRPPTSGLAALLAAAQRHMLPSRGDGEGVAAAAAAAVPPPAGFNSRRGFNSQELANVAYAAVGLRAAPPPEWLAVFEAALLAALPAARPQEVANALLALTKLRHTPGEDLLAGVTAYAAAHEERLSELDRDQLARAAASIAARRAHLAAAAARQARAPADGEGGLAVGARPHPCAEGDDGAQPLQPQQPGAVHPPPGAAAAPRHRVSPCSAHRRAATGLATDSVPADGWQPPANLGFVVVPAAAAAAQ